MIIPLHAANPSPMTGAGNWTYYLPGRHPVLIDAGTGQPAHLDAIAAATAGGPGRVLVTHGHGDHVSGVTALAERWPSSTFAKYPWPGRDDRYQVAWQPLADGDVVPAGDGELHVIHTPGHAPDHVAFWDPDTRTIFSGDLVTPHTTVVILVSSGGSLTQYLHSLERILQLSPLELMPAHGGPVDDPEAIIRRYLEHRRQREVQVLTALEDGLRTVDEITRRIYVGLADVMLPMAKENVIAHLMKLQDEGLAKRERDDWHPVT